MAKYRNRVQHGYEAISKPMVGDLVQAWSDIERGFEVLGVVLECRGIECKILWMSESQPIGWWKRMQLKVVSNASG